MAQSGTGAGYGYDQNNRLTSFTKPGATASYRYDGAGTRVAKTVGGVTTSFVYDDAALSNLLTDGTNDYLYGPGGLPVEQTSAVGAYWFVHDQIGSTTALLDASGGRVAAYTYSPYGGLSAIGTVSTPLRYTGQYTDAESGLVFLRARYYDPATASIGGCGQRRGCSSASVRGDLEVLRAGIGRRGLRCAGGSGFGRLRGTPSCVVVCGGSLRVRRSRSSSREMR